MQILHEEGCLLDLQSCAKRRKVLDNQYVCQSATVCYLPFAIATISFVTILVSSTTIV